MQKISSEIIYLSLAYISTVWASSFFMELVIATGTLVTAKVVDHYSRKRIIALIDKLIAWINKTIQRIKNHYNNL